LPTPTPHVTLSVMRDGHRWTSIPRREEILESRPVS
jgi:hypothetical protein